MSKQLRRGPATGEAYPGFVLPGLDREKRRSLIDSNRPRPRNWTRPKISPQRHRVHREKFENGFSTANGHESTRTKRIMALQDYRTEHLTSDKPALGRSLSPTSVFSVSRW